MNGYLLLSYDGEEQLPVSLQSPPFAGAARQRNEQLMPRNPPKPKSIAMLVCDTVIKDASTGKSSIIGVFDQIHAFTVPAQHGQMFVYARITNAEGEYDLEIQLVDLSDATQDKVLGALKTKATVKDRFVPSDIFLGFQGLVFPSFGNYVFRLVMNGLFVEDTKFKVSQIKQEEAS